MKTDKDHEITNTFSRQIYWLSYETLETNWKPCTGSLMPTKEANCTTN